MKSVLARQTSAELLRLDMKQTNSACETKQQLTNPPEL